MTYRPVIEISEAQKNLVKSLAKEKQMEEKKLLGRLIGSALLRECIS